jgi:hypothetical protein
MRQPRKSIFTHLFLINLLLISHSLSNDFNDVVEESEGSEYHEDSEQEILMNVKNLEETLTIFPKVFLYITKDNCDYCRSLDPVFEEVFRIIQKDQTCREIFIFFNYLLILKHWQKLYLSSRILEIQKSFLKGGGLGCFLI